MEVKELIEEYNNLYCWDKEKFCKKLGLIDEEYYEETISDLEDRDIDNMSGYDIMEVVRDMGLEREFIKDCDDEDIIYGFIRNKSYLNRHFANLNEEILVDLKNEIEEILIEKKK